MKTILFSLRFVASTLVVGLTPFVGGCGDSGQRQAYEQAEKAEQHLTGETAAAVIASYQDVIRLRPESSWAKKAQSRIDAVQAKVRSDDVHKSIFQEHGVD